MFIMFGWCEKLSLVLLSVSSHCILVGITLYSPLCSPSKCRLFNKQRPSSLSRRERLRAKQLHIENEAGFKVNKVKKINQANSS